MASPEIGGRIEEKPSSKRNTSGKLRRKAGEGEKTAKVVEGAVGELGTRPHPPG